MTERRGGGAGGSRSSQGLKDQGRVEGPTQSSIVTLEKRNQRGEVLGSRKGSGARGRVPGSPGVCPRGWGCPACLRQAGVAAEMGGGPGGGGAAGGGLGGGGGRRAGAARGRVFGIPGCPGLHSPPWASRDETRSSLRHRVPPGRVASSDPRLASGRPPPGRFAFVTWVALLSSPQNQVFPPQGHPVSPTSNTSLGHQELSAGGRSDRPSQALPSEGPLPPVPGQMGRNKSDGLEKEPCTKRAGP